MKLDDAYIGQKVGFSFNGEKYIGIINSLEDTHALVSFNDRDDSIIGLKRLIGVCENDN